MKFPKQINLIELCNFLNCEYKGNEDVVITGINEIHRVESGDIVFVDHPKYYKKALESNADVIIINKEVDVPRGKAIIISDAPFHDFNKITTKYKPVANWNNELGKNNTIHPTAQIFPNAVIGNNVQIGENTVIQSGVVICDDTVIGKNVLIGPNTVIGHNAFYYKKEDGKYTRMHSCGNVIIEDDVEIGALCTVDKGVTATTKIGKGTKIDNQVHVGHDTLIGENCLFAANVGIAGCVTVKNNVTMWGQVGVVSGITINENVILMGKSGVLHDLEPNKTYLGTPAVEVFKKWREIAYAKQVPEIIRELKVKNDLK
jgi:UDP-3-O-[3-hydroxymyristoyl] glucosamine N-acyltransferase